MMRAIRLSSIFWVLAVLVAAAQTETGAGETVLLDGKSLWHCRFVKGTELIRKESGELSHIVESPLWQRVRIDGKYVKKTTALPAVRRRPGKPSAKWMEPDFDDSSWRLHAGPFNGAGSNKSYRQNLCVKMRLVFLRGKFQVANPASGHLTLSMAFEGGAAVYVNGKEIKRSHLPKGELTLSTPAEDYPEDAYFIEGRLVGGDMHKKHPKVFAKRVRRFEGVKIPASALRKGVNVLAVRLHCAPLNEKVFSAKLMKGSRKYSLWPRVGLEELKLAVHGMASVRPGIRTGDRPKGFRVWNHTVAGRITVADCGDPADTLHPVRIVGVRNGTFTGVVGTSSDAAIRGLKAVASVLTGPGSIPASNVELLYPRPDRPGLRSSHPDEFDTLEKSAPGEVPVGKYGAVQPIWIRVRVPADAKPGDYTGKVTIVTAGGKPVEVPVALQVIDWKMPDPGAFTTHMGLVQSPGSLAMKYGVEMWSEEHWKLVDESLRLMGQLGARVLYLPLVARTHFGNAHSMVTWVKKGDSYTHDFSTVEKYVATAAKRFGGNIPVVCAYAWTPVKMAPHWAGKTVATKKEFKGILGGDLDKADEFFRDREILFSVKDPATKELKVLKGPKWGTPECDAFWKPVMAGVKSILAKHGLEKSMMVGLCGDFTPGEGAVKTLAATAPWAPWVVHSHATSWLRNGVRKQPVGYMVFVWGGYPWSPDLVNKYSRRSRFAGWKCSKLVGKFGRNEFRQKMSPQSEHRVFPEASIVADGVFGSFGEGGKKDHTGVDGIARMGADFWPVMKDKRGRVKGILAGRYVPWGGLDISSHGIHYVIGPGRKGPVTTARFEMLRECLQECQARILLEKILADPARRGKIGEKWAKRTQELLDRRTRVTMDFDITHKGKHDKRFYVCSGWQERSRLLYTAAAETSRKLTNPPQ